MTERVKQILAERRQLTLRQLARRMKVKPAELEPVMDRLVAAGEVLTACPGCANCTCRSMTGIVSYRLPDNSL